MEISSPLPRTEEHIGNRTCSLQPVLLAQITTFLTNSWPHQPDNQAEKVDFI